ncbi:MAG: hypothetical protein A2202_05610 [Bdellovibrionales bacterium RIFOXYA1_FULL_36_14]|nr:MAG: hypothetical protein A2202_05610 [Bdellovibrionales bacterium RIFOXYA1_FULL_36_14]
MTEIYFYDLSSLIFSSISSFFFSHTFLFFFDNDLNFQRVEKIISPMKMNKFFIFFIKNNFLIR